MVIVAAGDTYQTTIGIGKRGLLNDLFQFFEEIAEEGRGPAFMDQSLEGCGLVRTNFASAMRHSSLLIPIEQGSQRIKILYFVKMTEQGTDALISPCKVDGLLFGD
jgi:hypothetical protein